MRYALLVPLAAVVGCAQQPPQIVKAIPPPVFGTWAPQEFATNVQDWDRVAAKIADRLAAAHLLQIPSVPNDPASFQANVLGGQPRTNGHMISVDYDRYSMASQQVRDALMNEIINRGGPSGDIKVNLTVNVVAWGSRIDTQPYAPRREGVWQATAQVGDYIVSFREPFYFLDSDTGLYVQLPAPPPTPDQVLAATARHLSFTTK